MVFNALPTATMSGMIDICQGAIGNLTVDLTGTGSCYTPPPARAEMKGMVLSDRGDNVWEVRLISTDSTESFQGSIETTENIRWHSQVQLEASD